MAHLCLACPSWKLRLQAKFHDVGAAGHAVPPWLVAWHHIHHRDAIELMLSHQPDGETAYFNRLALTLLRIKRQQAPLVLLAGGIAGLALGIGSGTIGLLAALLAAFAYRYEASGWVVRTGLLLDRAWRDVGKVSTYRDLAPLPKLPG